MNKKRCSYCNNVLVIKPYETAKDFNRRAYCDMNCFNKHRYLIRAQKLIGTKSGLLTIQNIYQSNGVWLVDYVCDCGNEKTGKLSSFMKSPPEHCGCNHGCKTHGMSKTALYKSWCSMKRRCDFPDELHKKYYKDKGITYCKEWKAFDCFSKWALSNGYVDGYTIERLDNSKGYCPENCTWIPAKDQNKNKTNKSHLVIDGVDKSFTEWARECGLRESTIRMRVKYGFTGRDLIRPVRKKG